MRLFDKGYYPGSIAMIRPTLFIPLLLWALLSPSLVRAYNPKSPEVKALVAKGLSYLEKNATGTKLGERVLCALVFVKAEKPDHPVVKAALSALAAVNLKDLEFDVYSL